MRAAHCGLWPGHAYRAGTRPGARHEENKEWSGCRTDGLVAWPGCRSCRHANPVLWTIKVGTNAPCCAPGATASLIFAVEEWPESSLNWDSDAEKPIAHGRTASKVTRVTTIGTQWHTYIWPQQCISDDCQHARRSVVYCPYCLAGVTVNKRLRGRRQMLLQRSSQSRGNIHRVPPASLCDTGCAACRDRGKPQPPEEASWGALCPDGGVALVLRDAASKMHRRAARERRGSAILADIPFGRPGLSG